MPKVLSVCPSSGCLRAFALLPASGPFYFCALCWDALLPPNALHGWLLLIQVLVQMFPPQRSLSCLRGSPASHSLMLSSLYSVYCLHSTYHDLKSLFVYFTHSLSSLRPPSKTGTGSVLFTAVFLAFRAMPSSGPLTNIY